MNTPNDEILVAFVDGELDAAAFREVAAIVASDPAVADEVRKLRQSATLVRSVMNQPEYQQLSTCVLSTVARRTMTRRRALSEAAAGVAFLVGGFAAGFAANKLTAQPQQFVRRLQGEIADYHAMYAREDEHQTEVGADRVAHIQEWLGSRLNRNLRVPDLTSRRLSFRGARLLAVDGRPVVELLYQQPERPHEPMGLCISYSGGGQSDPVASVTNGLNQVMWQRHGYVYVLVGWMGADVLTSLASQLVDPLDIIG
jgi:anti-sigma factor RsiW